MSSTPQTLPALILHQIFTYSSRKPSAEYPPRKLMVGYNDVSSVLRACSSWREVAAAILLYQVDLTVELKPRAHLAVSLRACDKVKEVVLMFDTEKIFNGSALVKLREGPLKDSVFASAMKLYFNFIGPLPTGRVDTFLLSENALAFFREMWRLFPQATQTSINNSWASRDDVFPSYANYLLSGIMAGKTGIKTFGTWLAANPGLVLDDRPLQRIATSIKRASPGLIDIIHRNSPTLQHLNLHIPLSVVFNQLVVDDSGKVVTYPCLHDLSLINRTNEPRLSASLFTSPEGTPFPALEKLMFHTQYPFANDILLRGSQYSLKTLSMVFTEDTLGTFKRCGVFDSRRFAALEVVRLERWNARDLRFIGSHVSNIFSTFSHVQVINVKGQSDIIFGNIKPHLDDMSRTIRVLTIDQLDCTIEQMILLIKSLPFLRDLKVAPIESAALNNAPDVMYNEQDQGTVAMSSIRKACGLMSAEGLELASGPPVSQTSLQVDMRMGIGVELSIYFRLMVILLLRCPYIRSFNSVLGQGSSISSSHISSNPVFIEFAARIGARHGNRLD